MAIAVKADPGSGAGCPLPHLKVGGSPRVATRAGVPPDYLPAVAADRERALEDTFGHPHARGSVPAPRW